MSETEGQSLNLPLVDHVPPRLRQARKARGLTLKEVAAAMGTSPQTVQRLEKATLALNMRWLGLYCDALGVDPAVIVRRDHLPSPPITEADLPALFAMYLETLASQIKTHGLPGRDQPPPPEGDQS